MHMHRSSCALELMANNSCHIDLKWQATAGGRALLAELRGAAAAASPGALVCLANVAQNRSCGMQVVSR